MALLSLALLVGGFAAVWATGHPRRTAPRVAQAVGRLVLCLVVVAAFVAHLLHWPWLVMLPLVALFTGAGSAYVWAAGRNRSAARGRPVTRAGTGRMDVPPDRS